MSIVDVFKQPSELHVRFREANLRVACPVQRSNLQSCMSGSEKQPSELYVRFREATSRVACPVQRSNLQSCMSGSEKQPSELHVRFSEAASRVACPAGSERQPPELQFFMFFLSFKISYSAPFLCKLNRRLCGRRDKKIRDLFLREKNDNIIVNQ